MANTPHPLRVLITNIRLDGRSGTEVVTYNLATGLKAAGHQPMVYSPHLGSIAEELRSQGIPVLSRIDQIRTPPDFIHGHHVVQTGVAATRFPKVPGLFVCHDFTAWHDEPPLLDNILHFVAVGDTTLDRLTIEGAIDPSRVSLVENATDMQRFQPGPPVPEKPRKALVMLKGAAQLAPIEAACRLRGIQLDVAGAVTGRIHEHLEDLFPAYDLVFASGLTAIEAMACLRPVILCDHRGLAGFVSPQRYPQWRAQNFGLRALSSPLTVQALLSELDRVLPSEAIQVGNRVRGDCSLEPWIGRYLGLYLSCIERFRDRADDVSPASFAIHMEKWCSATTSSLRRQSALKDSTRITSLTGLLPLTPEQRTMVNDGMRLALTGFHQEEPWGRWTARDHAVVTAVCPPSSKPQWIQVEYLPFLSAAIRTRQTSFSINGAQPTICNDEDSGPREIKTCRVPIGPSLQETGAIFITISTPHSASPQSQGQGSDTRRLGVGIVAISLVDSGTPATPHNESDPVPETETGICTVVLSHKSPKSLVNAVRSLIIQQDARDVVVVNSGGGDAQGLLNAAGLDVRVIEHADRLYPGGARNLGLACTTHRYVAFLASDCLAGPHWVASRRLAHEAGHAAVASALLCHLPGNPVALASHLTLFCRRMPRISPALAQCYGASYDRRLFSQHGLFREDLEGGEDTDFHLRLPPEQRPVWFPSIQTVHCGPSTMRGFLRDQYLRGRRASTAWQAISGRKRTSFAWGILGRIASTLKISLMVSEKTSLLSTLVALPLIVLGGLTYAAGALAVPARSLQDPAPVIEPQQAAR